MRKKYCRYTSVLPPVVRIIPYLAEKQCLSTAKNLDSPSVGVEKNHSESQPHHDVYRHTSLGATVLAFSVNYTAVHL